VSSFVIDASVALKWFTEEEYSEAALRFLDPHIDLHAPDFFFLETDNVICKWIRRGFITEREGRDVRTAVRRIPIRQYPFPNLLDPAFRIANITKRSLYDCLYVSLAVFLDAMVVTADRRLFEGLSGGTFKGQVMWVEEEL